MWVLEARANAEKITYPVVWEKIKDADNVIDYDIREEQTKDISAEINANNQTTTGMATVIPGINAPKLIEGTSIISTPVLWYIYTYATFYWEYITSWYTKLRCYSLSNSLWEPEFTISPNQSYLKIPADWVYQLDIERPYWWYEWYWETDLITDKQNLASDVWNFNQAHTTSIKVTLSKWELISWNCTYVNIWTGNRRPSMFIAITRLW